MDPSPDEDRQYWEGLLARATEVSILRLKRAETPEGASPPQSWGVGVEGAPSVVMIRDTDEGLDVSVDWFSLCAKAIGRLEQDPAAYLAGTVGLGMTVGAVLGRSGAAAVAGAVVGGLVGLFSHTKRR